MKTKLLSSLVAGTIVFFILAGQPHGTLTRMIYGAPEHPESGRSCDLPLDWRYASVGDQVAVTGPYQGRHIDGIVIGIDTSTFVLTSNSEFSAGEHVCVTGNITGVGKNNTLVVVQVTNTLLVDSAAGSYWEY